MDVDLRKFPSIPYKTAQAGIGGNLWKFLLARPPRTVCGFAKREREFLSIPFTRHNTGDFSKCQKWAQKNRKPFLDFLSWCAVLCNGGYSVFRYGCSSKRNLNREATSRCFMLSSVSLSICPFSMAAIRILHAKAPPFSFAGTAKSCGLDTRSYSGNVRTLPRFPAVYNPRKIKENDFPVSIRQR